MKKAAALITGIFLSAAIAVGSTGCGGDDGKTYTLQYTAEGVTYSVEVSGGQPYTIESVPQKEGYDFVGLYDAAEGGTQYVTAEGNSVDVYKGKSGMVLYPLWNPKTYDIILDYGGAEVTGARQLSVKYDSPLPELPKNLTLSHKDFTGWYTEEDCSGVKVADKHGLIPVVSILNSNNFDISERYIYLYAGFETEKVTVTAVFGDGFANEEIEVPYGSPISKVVPKTRFDGMAPLVWSETEDGSKTFTGAITKPITLYAMEYAPVIDFDANGGKEVTPIVAVAGSAVTLPVPVKKNYVFAYWAFPDGDGAEVTKMPASGLTLKAIWKSKITFDANGGGGVADLTALPGESVELPAASRDGYLFAGWYKADKTQYTGTTMPSESISLKAGWYKLETRKIILKSEDDGYFEYEWTYNIAIKETNKELGPSVKDRLTLNLKDCLPESGGSVTLSVSCQIAATSEGHWGGFYFYDGPLVSDANYLGKDTEEIPGDWTWRTYTFELTAEARSNILYLCYYGKSGPSKPSGHSNSLLRFKDVWVNVGYPDASKLFL